MTISLSITGQLQVFEVINRFLTALESVVPRYIGDIIVTKGEDNIIFVEATYMNEEEANQALENVSTISSNLLSETGVWIVLSPRII